MPYLHTSAEAKFLYVQHEQLYDSTTHAAAPDAANAASDAAASNEAGSVAAQMTLMARLESGKSACQQR